MELIGYWGHFVPFHFCLIKKLFLKISYISTIYIISTNLPSPISPTSLPTPFKIHYFFNT